MRINKLIIKNINSLAGEHTIDFDDINERSEGVYLIVGATDPENNDPGLYSHLVFLEL
ncbi:MAG: hypothetical protein IPN55_18360 [Saprospiraceae bacterium]|nr:hypothetical protein [Candidatus Brachybacter algidus]